MNLYRRIQTLRFRIADRWAHRWSFRIPEEEKEQRRQFAETLNSFSPYLPHGGVFPDLSSASIPSTSGHAISGSLDLGPMILSPSTHIVRRLNPYEQAAERFMQRRSSPE